MDNESLYNETQHYVISVCEEYIPSKHEIPIIERDLEKLRMKLGEAKSEAEKRVIEFGIQHREQDLERAQKVVAEYEYLLRGLNDEEKNIINQLYSFGRTWKQVVDENGHAIYEKKISRCKKKAISHMAERKMRRAIIDKI